ncbi:uncharacterized protein LOC117569670 [Drosophila albomicans]|uniref:Uncharacterized protein LOC117569670 n=1 Tax=Drosophila albomicans TaxID=7291 RepID=A0A6P8X4V5_DROAB|nr:uncharacterized protein LOC117569670 [Drosophila albomicans]
MLLLQVREKPLKISQHVTKLWYQLCDLSNLFAPEFSLLNNLRLNIVDMALPQGAFAACKLREQFQERDMILSRLRAANNADKADNNTQREYLPVKYNDKLMNSIWGLYNRYSPHNVKKNEFAPPKY